MGFLLVSPLALPLVLLRKLIRDGAFPVGLLQPFCRPRGLWIKQALFSIECCASRSIMPLETHLGLPLDMGKGSGISC